MEFQEVGYEQWPGLYLAICRTCDDRGVIGVWEEAGLEDVVMVTTSVCKNLATCIGVDLGRLHVAPCSD